MRNNAQKSALRIAMAILNGDLEMIEGCRKLTRQLSDAGLRSDPDALVIIAVESETDHFPIGAERDNWDPSALALKDAELKAYIDGARPFVSAACHALASKLMSSDANDGPPN